MYSKFGTSLELATGYMAQGLEIRTQIIFNAIFYSFCKAQTLNSCRAPNVLGQAASSAFFPARMNSDEQWTFYPQSLVKQFNPSIRALFAPADIIIEINTGKIHIANSRL